MTNHKSSQWSAEQLARAREYGDIVDVGFPVISPMATEEEVRTVAEINAAKVIRQNPKAVLCQGEYTATFLIARILLSQGIPVFAACSERQVLETSDTNGETKKVSVFAFVKFRRYEQEEGHGD